MATIRFVQPSILYRCMSSAIRWVKNGEGGWTGFLGHIAVANMSADLMEATALGNKVGGILKVHSIHKDSQFNFTSGKVEAYLDMVVTLYIAKRLQP